jgi:hypothetical protein
VAEQKGFETELGVLEIADGIFTRPGEIAHGLIFELREIDRGKIPRARQAGQLHGVPAIGFDAIAGLFGNQRGRHHPAIVVFLGQIALEPIATGTGFVDEDQMFGFGLDLSGELIDVALTGANASEVGDLGTVILSHVRHSD